MSHYGQRHTQLLTPAPLLFYATYAFIDAIEDTPLMPYTLLVICRYYAELTLIEPYAIAITITDYAITPLRRGRCLSPAAIHIVKRYTLPYAATLVYTY